MTYSHVGFGSHDNPLRGLSEAERKNLVGGDLYKWLPPDDDDSFFGVDRSRADEALELLRLPIVHSSDDWRPYQRRVRRRARIVLS